MLPDLEEAGRNGVQLNRSSLSRQARLFFFLPFPPFNVKVSNDCSIFHFSTTFYIFIPFFCSISLFIVYLETGDFDSDIDIFDQWKTCHS